MGNDLVCPESNPIGGGRGCSRFWPSEVATTPHRDDVTLSELDLSAGPVALSSEVLCCPVLYLELRNVFEVFFVVRDKDQIMSKCR